MYRWRRRAQGIGGGGGYEQEKQPRRSRRKRRAKKGDLVGWGGGGGSGPSQTPSTGLRHPSFKHCVFSYAIGSRKLSANEQFFCWCSNSSMFATTTQIISDVCFITDHVAYASSNKTKSFESRRNSFLSFIFFIFFIFFIIYFFTHVYVLMLGTRLLPQFYQYRPFRRALTASVDSCAEIKSALQWRNQIWQSLEEGAGKRCSEFGAEQ